MPSYSAHAVLSRDKTPHRTLSLHRNKERSEQQISSNAQLTLTCNDEKHRRKPAPTMPQPLRCHNTIFTLSHGNLAAINWFHSLPSQRFQTLLTLFPKSFSPFPHGTCLLSVSSQYLALEEDYLPFCAPVPKYATLNNTPNALDPNGIRDSHPLWRILPKRLTSGLALVMPIKTTIQEQSSRFTSWALPGSFAITKGIIFIFFSSAYLYA